MSLSNTGIDWVDGVPYSVRYGDVYYSKQGGLDETRKVFLAGNRLPERWQTPRRFAIGEIGFGTGLNFLATLAQWHESSSSGFLSYWAVEHTPLCLSDLRAVAARWPILRTYAEELFAVYPPLQSGWYRRHLCSGRVVLTLVFDEAAQGLTELDGRIDAWYLDGFAPARNPEAWSPQVCAQIARLSVPGSTFSTYTSAGTVRRALSDVGFHVNKAPGYAGKRERLYGEFHTPRGVSTSTRPWFELESAIVSGNQVAVVGAGVAGITAACRLDQAGYEVTLIEQQPKVGCAASGNAAAVVSPGGRHKRSDQSQLLRYAFDFTVAWLDQLRRQEEDLAWYPVGVFTVDSGDRHGDVADTAPPFILQHAGLNAMTSGDWNPRAGWLEPPRFLPHLLRRHGCRIVSGRPVELPRRMDQRWLLQGHNGMDIATVDAVVLATGVTDLLKVYGGWMPMTPVRGQITTIAASESPSPHLSCVLTKRRYVIPGPEPYMTVGASFHPNDTDTACREADDQFNLEVFSALWSGSRVPAALASRASLRAASPDYRPYVGPVPDVDGYVASYSALKQGNPRARFPGASYLPGLFVMLGFGSRGFTLAPFAAEVLADMIAGLPLPTPRSVIHGLHPGRYLVRALQRGENPGAAS